MRSLSWSRNTISGLGLFISAMLAMWFSPSDSRFALFTTIVVLFYGGSPPAIGWLIMAIIVDAI
jgi:hypothetical protein